ncbi:unnamed protein product [Amoebophrya sp. A120]|nr:unnamed protein product [Amoebophrya sp. A120]|eukprot:GSA120T00011522001.1
MAALDEKSKMATRRHHLAAAPSTANMSVKLLSAVFLSVLMNSFWPSTTTWKVMISASRSFPFDSCRGDLHAGAVLTELLAPYWEFIRPGPEAARDLAHADSVGVKLKWLIDKALEKRIP